MKRKAAESPYYSPARHIPGQMEMPVITWHPACLKCGQSYFCDEANCRLEHGHCPACDPIPHSQVIMPEDFDSYPRCDRRKRVYVVQWELPNGKPFAVALSPEGEVRGKSRVLSVRCMEVIIPIARRAVAEEIREQEERKMENAQKSLFSGRCR